MNWLAHLFLSKPDIESRLGNLLADLVKGVDRENLSINIKVGIKHHQEIDYFTDSNIIVYRSKQRISSVYRRFAGILIDGFYDHFLAKNWSIYSPNQSLDRFTAEIYDSFQAYPEALPRYASEVITRMAKEDWLGSYRSLTGIEYLLSRLSHRFSQRKNKREFHLEAAINELTDNYIDLESDFFEFFPELLKHAKS